MIVLDKLFVDLGSNSYDIFFSDNFLSLPECIKNVTKSRKVMIVTDSNVDRLYREEVENLLEENGLSVCHFAFDAGEENKNIDTISNICKAFIDNKLDRKSLVIALGGGVVGDMAGFSASIFMRGIDFIQIPTTLLSQSDSSVGGKTGIDFCGAKNILGAFHQPKLVYINVSVLKTLPEREFISGMGEVIKHGIIADSAFFEYIDDNYESVKSLEPHTLLKLCKKNCAIKAKVVSKDEKEMGLRAILNFGHTIGHAVEGYSDFTLTHGECVGLGMLGVSRIAVQRGLIEESTLFKISDVLEKYKFKKRVPIQDVNKVLDIMYMDKKTQNGVLKFVLPTKIGEVCIVNDVCRDEIIDALEFLADKI